MFENSSSIRERWNYVLFWTCRQWRSLLPTGEVLYIRNSVLHATATWTIERQHRGRTDTSRTIPFSACSMMLRFTSKSSTPALCMFCMLIDTATSEFGSATFYYQSTRMDGHSKMVDRANVSMLNFTAALHVVRGNEIRSLTSNFGRMKDTHHQETSLASPATYAYNEPILIWDCPSLWYVDCEM